MDRWNMARIAASCEAHLGMKVRQVFDPREILEILDRLEKGFLSPILDPRANDFTPSNGFWLVAEDTSGPVMAGGVRLDDLTGLDVTDYWSWHLERVFGHAPDPGRLSFPVKELSGRVAYFGDLKSNNAMGLKKSGREKLRAFTCIGHYLTSVSFNPDVTYCFIREADAERGAPISYGFLDVLPFLYRWREDPYPSGRPEWVAYLKSEKLAHLMESMERLIEESAGKRSVDVDLRLRQTGT